MGHGSNTNHLKPSLKSIRWTLAEFRHNGIMQSPLENYFNKCQQYKDERGLVKTTIYVSSGRSYANIFKLHNQMQGVKKDLIIFLVVGNNKTIHAPTSRDCYFC